MPVRRFNTRRFGIENILSTPEAKGVYIIKDRYDRPQYVGKSNNLTRRLLRRSRKLYEKRYHRRSLAETAVSTVKRRFNHMLYSKKRRGQKNELRLKVLTYNLSIIARLPSKFG